MASINKTKLRIIVSASPKLCVTQHFGDKNYCVMTDEHIITNLNINDNNKISNVLYGDIHHFEPFGVCVAELVSKSQDTNL